MGPTTNVSKATTTARAGNILSERSHIKRAGLFAMADPVIRNPLMVKNTASPIEPDEYPVAAWIGSFPEPVKDHECPKTTKLAATNRSALKLLSLLEQRSAILSGKGVILERAFQGMLQYAPRRESRAGIVMKSTTRSFQKDQCRTYHASRATRRP